MLGQPTVTRGRVSVIVPIYNVERYLRECLESIRVQNYPDLEVLMINDGSPDGSAAIAEEFARADRRFVLITKQNAGLGAARNTGIEHATGQFITFVDSDDAIPYDAYREMVASLYESGSDFVVGGVERWRGKVRRRDQWVTRVHGTDHRGIKLGELPEITLDVFAWNKMFRTDFFRTAIGAFPEGILYEDQEPTALAYTRSASFDVLARTTYYWRVRNDRSSITQNKLTIRDLRDRIAVARRVGEIYRTGASAEVYAEWRQKTAGFDFGHYYRLSPRGTDEYWDLLVSFARELNEMLTAADWGNVPAKERVLAHLIASDERGLTSRVIGAQAQYPDGVPAIRDGADFRIDLEKWDVPERSVPSGIAILSKADTPLKTGITRIEWSPDGELLIRGFAYVDKFALPLESSELRVQAVAASGMVQDLEVERFAFEPDDPNLPITSYQEHPDSGFAVTVRPSAVLPGEDAFALRIELEAENLLRSGALKPQDQESIPRILPKTPSLTDTLVVRANLFEGLVVTRIVDRFAVEELEVSGRRVRLALTAGPGGLASARLTVVNTAGGVSLTVGVPQLADGESRNIEFELPRLGRLRPGGGDSIWQFALHTPDLTTELPFPKLSPASRAALTHGAIRLAPSDSGRLVLLESAWNARVTRFSGGADGIVFEGFVDSSITDRPRFLLLRTDGTPVYATEQRIEPLTGAFRIRFSGDGAPAWGQPYRSSTAGGYGLCVLPESSTEVFRDSAPVGFADPFANGIRTVVGTENGLAEASDRGYRRSVFITLRGALATEDWRNPQRQTRIERLRERALERDPLPRTVLCMSFSGNSVHDSPGPLAEAMLEAGIVDEIVWAVTHRGLVPEGNARTVIVDSAEFVDLLHRAGYLLNSAHFPHYFRKRAGQKYLQTWHGTPLKKIANDVPADSLSDSYRDLMNREVGYWDALLAQGSQAGSLLQRAFGYDGVILEGGYPRNDFLADPRLVAEKRSAFRRRFGLGDAQPVVLYAPTWRDGSDRGIAGQDSEALDVSRVLAALGGDARILMRGHANTANAARSVTDPRVLDVSGQSDLSELIAASDLLITDYSSIFFDYARTGKPIVGYAPDLDAYASTLRGMYLDYASAFPGPIARSNAELESALRGLPGTIEPSNELVASVIASETGNASSDIISWLVRASETTRKTTNDA